jgi:hypothetical protein
MGDKLVRRVIAVETALTMQIQTGLNNPKSSVTERTEFHSLLFSLCAP